MRGIREIVELARLDFPHLLRIPASAAHYEKSEAAMLGGVTHCLMV
jgi:hypothetical protein